VTPPRLAPMLASSGSTPAGDGWAAEVKWDGFRIIATAAGESVTATGPATRSPSLRPR
jgi:ATP-dependent DNA ligase